MKVNAQRIYVSLVSLHEAFKNMHGHMRQSIEREAMYMAEQKQDVQTVAARECCI